MQHHAAWSASAQRLLPEGLRWLQRMVEINSWTDNREGVDRLGRLTAECFAELGFAAEFVPSVNPAYGDHLVLVRPGRSSRTLALVSHLDTVFPPEEEARHDFKWRPEGSRIYGPGTHDIKGGTVMIWLVLKLLQEHAPGELDAVTWRLFLNSSEETLSQDFGELCRARLGTAPVAALVFEAEGRRGGVTHMVVARKGRATWRVRAEGRSAHAGAKHPQGANAVVQLARTIQRLAGLTDYASELTFNVATVSGGEGLNRVPHAAEARGEFRAFDPEVYARAMAALGALAGPGEVASPVDGYACSVRVDILSESRPWPRNPGTDRLLAIWQEAGRSGGWEIGAEARGGLSDGNLLWDTLPTLDGLGPWGDHDHCSERSADGSKVPEYVDVTSFVPKAVLNAAALLELIGRSE